MFTGKEGVKENKDWLNVVTASGDKQVGLYCLTLEASETVADWI